MIYYGYLRRRSKCFGVNVADELRRIFVDQAVTVALAHGPKRTPERVRAMLGPRIDPGPDTVRGYYGIDTVEIARAQGRLPDDLVDSSETAAYVERDLKNWFGASAVELLRQGAAVK